MSRIFKAMLMIVLALYAGVCTAGEKQADLESIQTLMTKSGLSKQLEQIVPVLQADLARQNQGPHAITPEEMNELNTMMARAFDAKALKEEMQRHIQANLAAADIQAALAWLRSPLGERITRLEEDASTPEAYAEMQKMAGKLTENAGRVALVRKLDSAVKATETGVAVALNTQTALMAALTSGAAPEMRPTMEEIEKELLKQKGQIRSAVEQATLLSFLYTYRGLSDAEIAKYIDFAGSASGKTYHAVTSEGLNSAMTKSAHVLGRLISQKANKKAPGAARQQNI